MQMTVVKPGVLALSQLNDQVPNAVSDQLLKTAYNNWAPRVGISYSPDSKTVFRTGFGIFYNQDIGNAAFDMTRNIAARVSIFPAVTGQGLPWSQGPGGPIRKRPGNCPGPASLRVCRRLQPQDVIHDAVHV